VELAAEETKHVTMSLDARAFAFYDVAGKHWQADAGSFSILVGDSSADTPLTASVSLPKAISIGTQEKFGPQLRPRASDEAWQGLALVQVVPKE
jgi:beta-glucosidase